jgi:hypothetical protein
MAIAQTNPASVADPSDAKAEAARFVKSYAASTPFGAIGRWTEPVCVHVTGLSAPQEAAVRRRIEDVAASLGLPAAFGCEGFKVEIAFADDAQAVLDSARGLKPNPLGDRTSPTRDVKTVSMPIQAWYRTNGELFGADASALSFCSECSGSLGAGVSGGSRAFLYVLVIVDLRRTGDTNLGPLADYAAMLALSEPRALGQCNVLPSITDLFAACPGRPTPGGITPADAAYLHALYAANEAVIGSSQRAHVIERMADFLAGVGTSTARATAPAGGA